MSDELMTDLVRARLVEPDTSLAGFVLDGFPRTVGQAQRARRHDGPGRR